MTQGKEEGKLQSKLLPAWKVEGFRVKKTHEILTSGKPDIRCGHPKYGQLDVELKYKTSGEDGLVTGIKKLQRITIRDMNLAGMPAIGLVWSVLHHRYFLTFEETEDIRELDPRQWVDPVVDRCCSLVSVYAATRRMLRERKYPSADFLRI